MQATPADLELLAGARLFAQVDPAVLLEHAPCVEVVEVPDGTRVLAADEETHALYVILCGELGIFPDESARLSLVNLRPGDCVAEQVVLRQHVVRAHVVATATTRLAKIEAAEIWRLMRCLPVIALNVLGMLSEHGRLYLRLLFREAEFRQAIEAAAITDNTTGLLNRRGMMDVFERELVRCARSGLPVSLIVAAVDQFQKIRASVGRVGTEEVMRQCAAALRRTLRPGDHCARLGTDELCALLPGATTAEALQVAERLRRQVDGAPAQLGGMIEVNYTVSLGVVQCDEEDMIESLIAAADEGVVAAGQCGGNCVCASPREVSLGTGMAGGLVHVRG